MLISLMGYSMSINLILILKAILILILGYFAVKIVSSILENGAKKSKIPELVSEFVIKLFSAILYVFVILLAVGVFGVETGPIILGLSASLGLILGFGLQDTLTNLTSGLWIAVMKPLDKDETVQIGGITGKIVEVGIMATKLLTPDNVVITIPNKLVWGSPITNYTRMDLRRVDVAVGVSYGENLDNALSKALELISEHPKVLKDPAPAVVVTGLGESSVDLQLRAWTKTGDYWGVKGDLTKGIYEKYGKEGIEIPFPQMDIHVHKY
ncbi:small-conductance mechanosensitive channel [Methanococcus maripaludis]|uniref:Small-conductance mechanosensitive channel n=1 Tax=Methanococcus maripaludis TaxID=39152 RepID=A0A7J9P2V4_METMI|nr:mechanosensitive ion channel family protein [Methanococcus maripaludis]MBA2857543.1 small-conductance mechanosensitive channel [Methanococcus maripaludis]